MTEAVVLGCGVVGRKRALALASLGVPVRALYDLDAARARKLADELPSHPRVAASASEALSTDAVNFAVVATTHEVLAETAAVALSHGCDVLVEKPGGRRPVELDELQRAATTSDRVVRVGYNHRFHPAVRAASDIVRDARFGPMLWMRARYGHGARPGYEQEWRTNKSRSGGGELLDQGSHLIDLTHHLAGPATLAFAELRTSFWPTEVEDNAFLALRADAGAFAWLHASWTEWKNCFEMEIALTTARLDLRGLGGSYGVERLVVHSMAPEMGPPATAEQTWADPDDSWGRELADVLGGISGAPTIGAGLDDARAVVAIVEEAYNR